MSAPDPISPEDLELLRRLAARVAELRMETPAILALETARPVSLVAGQAMVFFEPFVQALFRLSDYRRYAALAERRDALERLMQFIEAAAAARDEARRDGGSSPSIPAERP